MNKKQTTVTVSVIIAVIIILVISLFLLKKDPVRAEEAQQNENEAEYTEETLSEFVSDKVYAPGKAKLIFDAFSTYYSGSTDDSEVIQEKEFEIDGFDGKKFYCSGVGVYYKRTDPDNVITLNTLISGMPVMSLYTCDLNEDGYSELIGVSSFGSGIVDERLTAVDLKNGMKYTLANRGKTDFFLKLSENGDLIAEERKYNTRSKDDPDTVVKTGKLTLAYGCLGIDDGSGFEDCKTTTVRTDEYKLTVFNGEGQVKTELVPDDLVITDSGTSPAGGYIRFKIGSVNENEKLTDHLADLGFEPLSISNVGYDGETVRSFIKNGMLVILNTETSVVSSVVPETTLTYIDLKTENAELFPEIREIETDVGKQFFYDVTPEGFEELTKYKIALRIAKTTYGIDRFELYLYRNRKLDYISTGPLYYSAVCMDDGSGVIKSALSVSAGFTGKSVGLIELGENGRSETHNGISEAEFEEKDGYLFIRYKVENEDTFEYKYVPYFNGAYMATGVSVTDGFNDGHGATQSLKIENLTD